LDLRAEVDATRLEALIMSGNAELSEISIAPATCSGC
jgi:hypothetical protein